MFAALCSEIDEHRVKAHTKFYLPLLMYGEGGKWHTVGKGFNCVVNDCVLGKSDQIVNPIIVMVDLVPYYSICAHLCL